MSASYLGSEIEQSHEALVEGYVDRHPWSTVQAIRDGVESETGVRIERIQGRLDRIGRRRILDSRPVEVGSIVRAYRLGAERQRLKSLGIEAVVDDGVLRVWVHARPDPRVADVVEAIRAEVEAAIRTRVLPLLVSPVVVEEEDDLAAWLRTEIAA